MTTVSCDGADLWYQLSGRGAPLTLIGGFALAQRQYEFCERYLAARHLMVTWNYRGCGRSSRSQTDPCSVDRWVDDLRAILDNAGIERTSLWATSTGSVLGIRFAAKYPERTNALITYPWFKSDNTWKDIYRTAYEIARVFGLRTLSGAFADVVMPPSVLYAKAGIAYRKWAGGVFEQNLDVATLDAVLEAYARVDLTADVQRLKCPTLLLMGDDSALNRDQKMNSASFTTLVSEFRRLNPQARLATIKGAGSTYCMITKPKECVAAVMNFLDAIDRRSRRARRLTARASGTNLG